MWMIILSDQHISKLQHSTATTKTLSFSTTAHGNSERATDNEIYSYKKFFGLNFAHFVRQVRTRILQGTSRSTDWSAGKSCGNAKTESEENCETITKNSIETVGQFHPSIAQSKNAEIIGELSHLSTERIT